MEAQEGLLLFLLDNADEGVPAANNPNVIYIQVGALDLRLSVVDPLLGVLHF